MYLRKGQPKIPQKKLLFSHLASNDTAWLLRSVVVSSGPVSLPQHQFVPSQSVCVCVRACDARVDSRPQTAFGSRSMAGTIPRPCWLGLLRQVLGPACVLDLSVVQVFGVARWEHACRGAHAASVFALSAGAVSFGQIVKALAMRIAGQLVQFQFSQELSKII